MLDGRVSWIHRIGSCANIDEFPRGRGQNARIRAIQGMGAHPERFQLEQGRRYEAQLKAVWLRR